MIFFKHGYLQFCILSKITSEPRYLYIFVHIGARNKVLNDIKFWGPRCNIWNFFFSVCYPHQIFTKLYFLAGVCIWQKIGKTLKKCFTIRNWILKFMVFPFSLKILFHFVINGVWYENKLTSNRVKWCIWDWRYELQQLEMHLYFWRDDIPGRKCTKCRWKEIWFVDAS